jgi:hypothetical protein
LQVKPQCQYRGLQTKRIFNPPKEPIVVVVVVGRKGLGQFLEKATLVIGQFRRNLYPNHYDLITATLLPQIGNPLPT